MIKRIDGELTHCPMCGKFPKHGDSIHPETWFCTRCNKLVATDETTKEDEKYVKDVCNIFRAEPISGEEFGDLTLKFDDRIMRKFFVLLYKKLQVIGGCDRSAVTIFYIKGNRKRAIQKFVDVNYHNGVSPNNHTINRLVKNGEVSVCPLGRIIVL